MAKKLFLLDGMALVYRAHFAFMARPILTSKGVNTSALYGFTQTLLDILNKQQPTHLAVAFDTQAPTQRHIEFPEYKAQREEMPEDLVLALPQVVRMLESFRVPVLKLDGYEADDLIGTLVSRAEPEGFISYMVTSDKDFGQLVTEKTFLYKPGRMGDSVEVLGPDEIRARWGIREPGQLVDILALMGDASDNIPGVPGIGEKTAIKLVGQYGSVEAVLDHADDLSGKLKESLKTHRDLAMLSKRLATIQRDVPFSVETQSLEVQPMDEAKVKQLLVEFEFNTLGRRLFGEDFRAGRGFEPGSGAPEKKDNQAELVLESAAGSKGQPALPLVSSKLKTLADTAHQYRVASTESQRAQLLGELSGAGVFGLHVQTTSADPKQARMLGLAFSLNPNSGWYVPMAPAEAKGIIGLFRPVLESEAIEKIGHDLKFAAGVLRWSGIALAGTLFDTQVAHSLIEPDMRHSLDYVSEVYLGHTPIPLTGKEDADLADLPPEKLADHAVEIADLALQLRQKLEPLLQQCGQERVFYDLESRLIPVLVDMECEGIRVDAAALGEFAEQLAREIATLEKNICQAAGTTFNVNSPKQLGQILFEVLKLSDAPKKTRTGQYATDEQTLQALAPDHQIVQQLLEYRAASKLKSTYADALPAAIWPKTNRVHTTYHQVSTTTGRLNSQDPNLQNIPIRTERGQEIRKAFVPRDQNYLLLSADYSQIELRIIAALSREVGLLEAFRTGADVHTATAARVFGVFPELVTPEMRRKAKMVNYGIAYGISAFGLAQRLGIPRKEAGEIIEEYFRQFGGIRRYMDDTIAFAREHGYVQTVTGRRRYLRDINSSNNTVRGAAERNAINAPIQGTAADMIKVAMIRIHEELQRRKLRTKLLLQVHDELVFDLHRREEAEVRSFVVEKMQNAIPLNVPIEVDVGVGENWLEAH